MHYGKMNNLNTKLLNMLMADVCKTTNPGSPFIYLGTPRLVASPRVERRKMVAVSFFNSAEMVSNVCIIACV